MLATVPNSSSIANIMRNIQELSRNGANVWVAFEREDAFFLFFF